MFSRVAIVGVGLLGGSMGRAVQKRKLALEVVGYDPSEDVLNMAMKLGAITSAAGNCAQCVRGADLVVLAAPVNATLKILTEIADFLPAGAVVTDVGSTKALVAERAAACLPRDVAFVGGHPMTGSEKAGVAALNEDLFENAVYVLTPQDSRNSISEMQDFVRGLGAYPLVMDAAEHDWLVAAVSHLPHLAASALVYTMAGMKDPDNKLLTLAAGGFRDTTRVAMGSPEIWRDICLTNRQNILNLLDRFSDSLAEARRLVAAGRGDDLLDFLQKARDYRLQVPYRGKGILPALYNLFVYVPDRPGVIGEVAGSLGQSGINIAEIELLRIREEEGGPLRLAFLSAKEREAAADRLGALGIRAQIQEG